MDRVKELEPIPADECGGGRKLAAMTEMFPTLQTGDPWPKQGPCQWVAKNRARDMERHYMQQVSDLQSELSAALEAVKRRDGLLAELAVIAARGGDCPTPKPECVPVCKDCWDNWIKTGGMRDEAENVQMRRRSGMHEAGV